MMINSRWSLRDYWLEWLQVVSKREDLEISIDIDTSRMIDSALLIPQIPIYKLFQKIDLEIVIDNKIKISRSIFSFMIC